MAKVKRHTQRRIPREKPVPRGLDKDGTLKSSPNIGKVCAYCSLERALTSEHIFPQCFQKTFDPISIAKTPAGDKAIPSELEIRDVCAGCNSGPLSQLDAYLCDLNDKYFSKIVHSGDSVRFEYDFDLLLRMLLKIGYNVARARKWPLRVWQDARQFILGNAPCPSGVHLFLQLVIPTPVKKTTRPVTPGTTEVPPLPMNVYQIDVSRFSGCTSAYWVSIWSYRFFVLHENPQMPREVRRRAVAKWLKSEKGAYKLSRRGVARIYASSVDVLDTLETHPIFDDQLAKARKVKSIIDSKKSRSKRN